MGPSIAQGFDVMNDLSRSNSPFSPADLTEGVLLNKLLPDLSPCGPVAFSRLRIPPVAFIGPCC